jgi:hypothetical protein
MDAAAGGRRAGTVDAIVGWHVDRLTSRPASLRTTSDLADKYGIELATVTGDVDLSTPTGRRVARMLGAAARHEAAHKAERQKRQRKQAAEAGRVAGGGHRPFGYEADRMTIVPEEAEIIRECVRRVQAMESLASLYVLSGRQAIAGARTAADLDPLVATNGLAGAADETMVLKRARGQAEGALFVTGRDVDEAEYALSFQPASGAWTLLDGPASDHTVGDTRAPRPVARDHCPADDAGDDQRHAHAHGHDHA